MIETSVIITSKISVLTRLDKLTEDGDKSQESHEKSDGQEDEDKGIELVFISLLIERVGGHRVVVVVEIASGHGSRLKQTKDKD